MDLKLDIDMPDVTPVIRAGRDIVRDVLNNVKGRVIDWKAYRITAIATIACIVLAAAICAGLFGLSLSQLKAMSEAKDDKPYFDYQTHLSVVLHFIFFTLLLCIILSTAIGTSMYYASQAGVDAMAEQLSDDMTLRKLTDAVNAYASNTVKLATASVTDKATSWVRNVSTKAKNSLNDLSQRAPDLLAAVTKTAFGANRQ